MPHTACTLLDANSHRAQAKSVNPVTLDKADDVHTITLHAWLYKDLGKITSSQCLSEPDLSPDISGFTM